MIFQDNHIQLFNKDCRDMSELQDESVQCVVTSPPYWGLRKYSGEQELIWGEPSSDEPCRHEWGERVYKQHSGRGGVGNKMMGTREDVPDMVLSDHTCSLCGAWKGSYGLEPTPEMYVQHTIEILREIRRVLRKDGVVWWNIGDSYWANRAENGLEWGDGKLSKAHSTRSGGKSHNILKPKDLCLIPFRVAIAAQEDGWWVRSVIIWSKPNPMPESVTGRPTTSHEYILMLTKNAGKSLYWTHRDSGGTRQKPKADYRWVNQVTQEEVATAPSDWKVKIKCPECDGKGKVTRFDGWYEFKDKCPICNGEKEIQTWKRINLWRGHDYYWDADAVRESAHPETQRGKSVNATESRGNMGGNLRTDLEKNRHIVYSRNIRSVWEFPTQPYPEAHFAVFPEKLPETCIKAATPEVGCCSKCGAPWERITKVSRSNESYWGKQGKTPEDVKSIGKYGDASASDGDRKRAGSDIRLGPTVSVETLGWQPSCNCCRKCDIMGLSTNERKVAHATQGQRTREGMEKGVEQEALGDQCGAPQEEQREATKVSQSLRPMPQGLYGQGEQQILQSDLLNEMDVGEQAREPLFTNGEEQPVSIQVEQGKDGKGSQASNGGVSGETPATQRVSSPHQRGQKRQSDTELGSANEADTRLEAHQETHELEPYDKVPSTILDPFCGAGTSLWVAKKLNRKAVGYELSEEYCRLIIERCRQQVML